MVKIKNFKDRKVWPGARISVNKQKLGFTLIEIIMAMAILVIGVMGVVRLLPVGLGASKSAELLSRAAFLAQEKIEQLKLMDFDQLCSANPGVPFAGQEGQYSWQAELVEVSLEGLSSSQNIRKLTLTVSWQEKNKTRSQEFVTYVGKYP